jgi:hypothetical protein
MDRTLPANAVVLVHDAGAVSFYTRFHLVDVVGLKTPWSAEVHRRLTLPSARARLGEAADEIARRSHADFFLTMWSVEQETRLLSRLVARGWRIVPIHYQCSYTLFAILPPKRGQAKPPGVARAHRHERRSRREARANQARPAIRTAIERKLDSVANGALSVVCPYDGSYGWTSNRVSYSSRTVSLSG